jgi:hypothetical protein
VADSRTGLGLSGGTAKQLTSTSPDTIKVLGVGSIPSTGVAAVAMNLGDASPPGNSSVTIAASTPAPAGSQSVHDQKSGNAEGLVVVTPNSSGNV